MDIVIDYNEAPRFEKLLDFTIDDLGFDFLVYTLRGAIPLERKKFPEDFLSSITDGRFGRECAAMREVSDYRIVIAEGKPRYSAEDKLMNGKLETNWTRVAVRNIMRSLRYIEGCDVETTDSIEGTALRVLEIGDYFDNPIHHSVQSRMRFDSRWYGDQYKGRFLYWLQGCGKDIGLGKARKIAQSFSSPKQIADSMDLGLCEKELLAIPGIGPATVKNFIEFWEGKMLTK